MEPVLPYLRTLSRLVHLLGLPSSTMEEVRDTLRLLVAYAREQGVTLQMDEWKLLVDGTPVPSGVTGLEELSTALFQHGVRRLALRQHASAAELLKCVRLLTEVPSDSPEEFEQRVAQLKLWHVTLSSSAQPEADEPEPAAIPEQVVLTHHLARVRSATAPLDATLALGELCDLAEEYARSERAEALAVVLTGIVRAERDVRNDDVKAACAKAIDRLSVPGIARLVAQLVPSLVTRPAAYRTHLEALGRCGNPGAAALIAHLMAAETIDERRIYFDAIVQLRAGIPMLIDALGHPQWFVVRNAACLLGEMEAEQADGALARLLEHRDERVREAAAGALARLETPTARAALQRMLQDSSPNVRQHAASAFAAGQGGKVATPLAAALDTESDGDVQLSILAALGRLGTPDAVQKLVRAALPQSGRPRPVSYRIAALEALAAARGSSALPTLRSLQNDAEPAVREAAKRLIAQTALSA